MTHITKQIDKYLVNGKEVTPQDYSILQGKERQDFEKYLKALNAGKK